MFIVIPLNGCYSYTDQLALGSYGPVTETDQNNLQYNITYTISCANSSGGCMGGYCPADTAMMVNSTITFPDAT